MSYKTPEEYTPEYISDRLQLTDLCTRYAVGVDRRDWDLWESCFTEGAIIDYTAFGGVKLVRPEMRTWMEQAIAPFAGTQHFTLNHEVEITGDTAKGRLGFYNPMPINMGQGMKFYIAGGWYIDEYVRTEEGWKFSYRAEEMSFDSSKFPMLRAYEAGYKEPEQE